MRLSHRLVAMHVAGVAILILVVLLERGLGFGRAQQAGARIIREHGARRRRLVPGALRTLVRDYSIWDEAYDAVITDDRDWLYNNIGNAAAEIGTLDLIVFIPRAGGPTFGWREGSDPQGIPDPLPAELVSDLAAMLEKGSNDNGASGTMLADFEGEPWAFSIARVIPVDGLPAGVLPADLPLQVHGLRLSPERLDLDRPQPAGRRARRSPMRRRRARRPIALRDDDGRVIRYVVWEPPRPGASILRLVALPLGLALLLIVGVSAISSAYAVRSARRLERALYDAKAADRSKTEFLSNVSHELRTPMNGILGVAQLLQTTRLDDEQKELVSVLFASATAQMALISDLLDISRMESGNRQLVSEPFEPAAILKDVTEMMRVAADKKAIGFDGDWSALDGLTVRGDSRAFRQIVTNLLGNAVKFTDRGGVRLTAGLERAGDRAGLMVSVADTGRGIPAEALPHIFERFYQVDGSLTRGVEGTGLGLAISQNLARMMGGRIEVGERRRGGARPSTSGSTSRSRAAGGEARDAA